MRSFAESFGGLSATMHGVIVSTILIPAAISAFFAGNLADLYGRQLTICTGAVIFGVGATLETVAHHLGLFLAGRVITGIGEGLFISLLTLYICEISPAKRR